MIRVKCVEKIRSNNKIIAYILKDEQGNLKKFKAEAVKYYIKTGALDVINLQLTSDNRLINKEIKQDLDIEKEDKTTKILNRAIVMGYDIVEIDTNCEHICYLIVKEKDNILLIPNDVRELEGALIKDLRGDLKVIGGKNLLTIKNIFNKAKLNIVDISKLDTTNLREMEYWFSNCDINQVIFGNIDTSKVTSMYKLFNSCKIGEIDISMFNISQLKEMFYMFENCEIGNLKLFEIDGTNLAGISAMFKYAEIGNDIELKIRNGNKLKYLTQAFLGAKIPNIKIEIDGGEIIENTESMFEYCNTESITIKGIKYKKLKRAYGMFDHCRAKTIDISDSNIEIDNTMIYECEAEIIK